MSDAAPVATGPLHRGVVAPDIALQMPAEAFGAYVHYLRTEGDLQLAYDALREWVHHDMYTCLYDFALSLRVAGNLLRTFSEGLLKTHLDACRELGVVPCVESESGGMEKYESMGADDEEVFMRDVASVRAVLVGVAETGGWCLKEQEAELQTACDALPYHRMLRTLHRVFGKARTGLQQAARDLLETCVRREMILQYVGADDAAYGDMVRSDAGGLGSSSSGGDEVATQPHDVACASDDEDAVTPV